ncbi:MAG: glycolate oxidase subunit GlcF [Alphaproteobacteria bacterium]|nr:glycolate oxidase subunit GlcF [Alphaproteobacteria bacterium]
MQTNFTALQLQDADTAEANRILRSCVHCGMCTATCPTFVELGDELDSPRGRIYLIKDMLENGRAATELEARHVDRCLSCLSCMTTCPSGVNYMHLVDHARRHIEETYQRPLPERVLRGALAFLLPYPRRFRAALKLAGIGRAMRGLIPGQSMTAQRLRAMLDLAPEALPAAQPVHGVHAAQAPRRGRVALLAGCAQQVLDPEINAATIRLLTRMGIEVVVPPEAGCCGALTHHMGRHHAAMEAARANIQAWSKLELDAVVINASGCGTTVKDYGFMFREESEAADAARISAMAMDITEVLAKFHYAPTRAAPGLTVAYHSACSLQHGQKITALPKQLLQRAGFTVKEPLEGHLCCGSAGTYNIMQPEIAGRLRARKLDNIRRTRADIIAAGNIGCLTQLAGDAMPTVHTVALLDWMAGGPLPAALQGHTASASSG